MGGVEAGTAGEGWGRVPLMRNAPGFRLWSFGFGQRGRVRMR